MQDQDKKEPDALLTAKSNDESARDEEVDESGASINLSEYKICFECNNFLNELMFFVTKSKLIDSMFQFLEIEENSQSSQQLNDVRQKFGLDLLDTQISGLESIKLEGDICDFEVTLSEEQNLSESSEEEEADEDEDEEEIEQLSDSQFRKHEEALQFQEESSGSDREQRKKRKKKYRKSDEEKLFE